MRYAAASRQGAVTLLDEHLKLRSTRPSRGPISEFCAAKTGGLASIITDAGVMRLEQLDAGVVLRELADAKFDCCAFEPDGSHLWCAATPGPAEVEVRVLEAPSLQVVARSVFATEFVGSPSHFTALPRPGSTALWLADGQGDSRLFWLTSGGEKITWRPEPHPFSRDAYPPVFNESGDEYLLNTGNAVHRFSHPEGRLLGTCECTLEDQVFEPSVFYLGTGSAAVRSCSGRLFRIEMDSMRLKEEIAVRDHEPKPTFCYYPALKDDTSLCTDILDFRRIGDWVVVIVQKEGSLTGPAARDSLLFCKLEQFQA